MMLKSLIGSFVGVLAAFGLVFGYGHLQDTGEQRIVSGLEMIDAWLVEQGSEGLRYDEVTYHPFRGGEVRNLVVLNPEGEHSLEIDRLAVNTVDLSTYEVDIAFEGGALTLGGDEDLARVLGDEQGRAPVSARLVTQRDGDTLVIEEFVFEFEDRFRTVGEADVANVGAADLDDIRLRDVTLRLEDRGALDVFREHQDEEVLSEVLAGRIKRLERWYGEDRSEWTLTHQFHIALMEARLSDSSRWMEFTLENAGDSGVRFGHMDPDEIGGVAAASDARLNLRVGG